MIAVQPTQSLTGGRGLPGLEIHALRGHLFVPGAAQGLVIIPDNDRIRPGAVGQAITQALHTARIATCHVSLLDATEAADPRKAVDIALLTRRLEAVFHFGQVRPRTTGLPVGLLGGHGMGQVVLSAAALRPAWLKAVVCFCNRPMPTAADYEAVQAATLFVVPGRNAALVRASEEVFWRLRCTSQFAVIRDAGRHFTAGGSLLACQQLITQWCLEHVAGVCPAAADPANTGEID